MGFSGPIGSAWNTSSTAPARWPLSSAAIRSASTRWPPRATLITQAPLGSWREQFGVHDALRLVGQRQHTDADNRIAPEIAAARSHRRSFSRPGMSLRERLQPESWKSNGNRLAAMAAADIAQAQHADARVARSPRQHALPPLAFRCCAGIEEALAAMDRSSTCITTYCAISCIRVGSTKRTSGTWRGRFGIAQEAIHARAQRKDRLQIGQAFHKPGRRPEAGEIVGCRPGHTPRGWR